MAVDATTGGWPAGARNLGLFWALLLVGLAGLAGLLQLLGAPPRPVRPEVLQEPVRTWDGTIAAPDTALLEPVVGSPGLVLPRIGAGGRTARQVYARPAPPADGRPRIAVVVSGMALSEGDSLAAIRALPPAVTLAVSPYAANAAPVLAAARAHGNELLASIPMEAAGTDSAGRRALLTGASDAENQANLEWALGRTQGYAGVTGAGDNGLRGERFAAQQSSFAATLEQIGRRGLFYVDPRPDAEGLTIAGARVGIVLDGQAGRAELDAKLTAAEQMARDRGSVVALAGPPRRAVVERLAAWADTLEARGFVLVPVSALVTEAAP